MTLEQMLAAIFPESTDDAPRPSKAQREILGHPSGPAWILAGPGSGKTDTLALFILRLVFVDKVLPVSIFATTFTEKAARNLDDRISDYRGRLAKSDPSVERVDLSQLRLGTLHGLCNDILQEFRAPNYQNVRLMDQFETSMFINEHVPFVKQPGAAVVPFWSNFSYLFGTRWSAAKGKAPQWQLGADALATLFNRIAEDNVDVAGMAAAGGHWAQLAALYEQYLGALETHFRCDFAQLQRQFLTFLNSASGAEFKNGTADRPQISWILVDEYQDTNLVQEAIYLNLASRAPHNVVVVGDDDQAMYRFRGGSVECMVSFDAACEVLLGIDKALVRTYPLIENYRSHPDIVTFCDDYITGFAEMHEVGARAAGKQSLIPKSDVTGPYRALGIVQGKKVPDAPAAVATIIRDLKDNGIIDDYSQTCILLKSTRESPFNAQPYVTALNGLGIDVYNPRSGNFLYQDEVKTLLGAIMYFADPSGQYTPDAIAGPLHDYVVDARNAYATVIRVNKPLREWMQNARANLAKHAGEWTPISLQDVLYLLLAHEPFLTWQTQPIRQVRLGRITALVESFATLPIPGQPDARRGSLKVEDDGSGIFRRFSKGFYELFLGYLVAKGVNDEEDDDVIVVPGAVPIMTMHQAKGLEFPFVFVGHMGETSKESAAHQLEDAFAAFPGNPQRVFVRPDAATRAKLDMIRQYYVAFSRAEYGLMFVGSETHFGKNAVPCGPSKGWLRDRIPVF